MGNTNVFLRATYWYFQTQIPWAYWLNSQGLDQWENRFVHCWDEFQQKKPVTSRLAKSKLSELEFTSIKSPNSPQGNIIKPCIKIPVCDAGNIFQCLGTEYCRLEITKFPAVLRFQRVFYAMNLLLTALTFYFTRSHLPHMFSGTGNFYKIHLITIPSKLILREPTF
jgi:hypothetical protein